MKDRTRSPRRLALGVGAALTGVGILVLWRGWTPAREGAPDVLGPPPSTGSVGPGAPSARPGLAPPEAGQLSRSPSAPGSSAATTRDSGAARESAPADVPGDALWLDGRVVLPLDTPADEALRVVARGRRFAGSSRARTHGSSVGADGTFRVAFAPETRNGTLRLEGSYLYLPRPVRLKPAERTDEEVVLEPELGARVRVEVQLPAGASVDHLERTRVQSIVWDASSNFAGPSRAASDHDGGVFTLDAVPAGFELEIGVESTGLCSAERTYAALAAGETRDLTVALTRGVHLTGRVLARDGSAPARTILSVRTGSRFLGTSIDVALNGEGESEPGRFDVRGVHPGDVTILAQAPGWNDAQIELGDLADGDERLGLELLLERGSVVAGLVRWPDGRAAGGVRVRAIQEDADETGLDLERGSFSAVTTDDGRFEITGLEHGTCSLRARARPPAPAAVEGESTKERMQRRRAARKAPYWRARVDAVTVPATRVTLELSDGHVLIGRVIDEAGRPHERFDVRVRDATAKSSPLRAGDTSIRDSFQGTDGQFALAGVPAGEWLVSASVSDGATSSAVPLSVPYSAPLELVVPRSAHLRGIVLDPAGAPVPGARIAYERSEQRLEDWTVFRADHGEAGDDGRFDLTLPPARYVVHANSSGYGPSAPRTVDLEPGGSRDDVELRLRAGARITGTLDASLGVTRDREVSLDHTEGSGLDDTRTDDAGRFEFGGLGPGTYDVYVSAVDADDFGDWVASMEVVLEHEGQTIDVLLGVPAEGGVQARGRVTRAGAPVAGLRVRWREMSGAYERAVETTTTGAYALTVRGGKGYFVELGPSGQGAPSVWVEIPEHTDPFQKDFELPSAELRGRVVDTTGRPVADAQIQLVSPQGTTRFQDTDAAGAFVFEEVYEGLHTLVAEKPPWAYPGGVPLLGDVRLRGVDVRGAGIRDMELVMPAPATIVGTVLGPGDAPVTDAEIEVLDEHGLLARSGWADKSDATGHFQLSGLGAGTYRLRATSGTGTGDPVDVELAAGGRATIALRTP